MSWFSRFIGNKEAEKEFLGWVKVSAMDPLAREHGLIRDLVSELITLGDLPTSNYNPDLSRLESSHPILSGDRDQQARCVHCLVVWLAVVDGKARAFRSGAKDQHNPHLENGWKEIWEMRRLLHCVMTKLLTRKQPLSARPCIRCWIGAWRQARAI